MFGPYNPQVNIDRINNEIRQLENLRNNYQQIPQQQQPIQNIINTGNASQIDFEARMLNENEEPSEILVQRKTAFISLKKGLLSIKELNGDITEYKIELPKTPEQIENEELKEKLKEMENKINELTNDSTNTKKWKSDSTIDESNESTTKTNGRNVSK